MYDTLRETTMPAVVAPRYGSADVLRTAEVPVPVPAADQVLIAVGASAVDRGVVHLLHGTPYVARLAFGLRRPKQPVPGLDVSGTVVEVGADVTRFRPGDAVYGVATGAYAQFAVAKESKLAERPTGLTDVEAAVVPISGLTALQAVRDVAAVQPGERVLVTGASGGVGSYAVQVAKAFGGHVTALASAPKMDFVAELGADEVIDRTTFAVDENAGRFDVVLFIAGTQTVRELRRLLTPKGTLVVIGAEDGRQILGIGRQLRAIALSPFVSQKLTMHMSREDHRDVAALTAMIDAGTLRPTLDRAYPLADAASAIADLERGRAKGKLAIAVA
jgi:NADPH:quinone reductase-like Zn-dependent oxidoreductase